MSVLCEVDGSKVKWNFEMVTETTVVPGPTQHQVSSEVYKELVEKSVPMNGPVDWSFPTRNFERVIKGQGLAVSTEGNNFPVKALYIVGSNEPGEIVVHWAPYTKSRADKSLYDNGAPDVFFGVVKPAEQVFRRTDATTTGPATSTRCLPGGTGGESDDESIPDDVEYVGQSDDEANPRRDAKEHRYQEEEHDHIFHPTYHIMTKKSWKYMMKMPQVRRLINANKPVNIAIKNMVVRHGRHGNYERLVRFQIVNERSRKVRIQWHEEVTQD